MKAITWIFQGILIAGFGLLGGQKLVMPIADLIAFGMHWIEDFPAWQVRAIGGLEVLAVLGLLLPYFLKFLPKILVPMAAAGLGLTMIGAVATHVTRGDPALSTIVTTVLTGMCMFVAYRRYKETTESA